MFASIASQLLDYCTAIVPRRLLPSRQDRTSVQRHARDHFTSRRSIEYARRKRETAQPPANTTAPPSHNEESDSIRFEPIRVNYKTKEQSREGNA